MYAYMDLDARAVIAIGWNRVCAAARVCIRACVSTYVRGKKDRVHYYEDIERAIAGNYDREIKRKKEKRE